MTQNERIHTYGVEEERSDLVLRTGPAEELEVMFMRSRREAIAIGLSKERRREYGGRRRGVGRGKIRLVRKGTKSNGQFGNGVVVKQPCGGAT
jgi:hypothetical protein